MGCTNVGMRIIRDGSDRGGGVLKLAAFKGMTIYK